MALTFAQPVFFKSLQAGPLRCSQKSLVLSRPVQQRANVVSQLADSSGRTTKSPPATEDVFAISAGKDLFFAGMDENIAISILDTDLGALKDPDDRFIAAERLKFYPSEASTDALVCFIGKFDTSAMSQYKLEDCVARRKAIESLGRHKGAHRRDIIIDLLVSCLVENDNYVVEVAVWSLAEIGISENVSALEAITALLQKETIAKRVVIQTLMRASYTPALPHIRKFVEDSDPTVASAAVTAVTIFTEVPSGMAPVVDILKSSSLIERRAALEDLNLANYVPAIPHIAVCPNSLVLRARAIRSLLGVEKKRSLEAMETLDDETAMLLDRLIWDNPNDLDLLGMKKETRKSRDPARNIRQLYKNDAIFPYLASRTLAEDHRDSESGEVGADVLKSYNDLKYFDYFASYHVYKTLGWLQYLPAYDVLIDNAENLPPRFFNHQAGAITALAELGNTEAIPIIHRIAQKTPIWEVKYACLIAVERLGDGGALRNELKNDMDWLIRVRASSKLDFLHLKNTFS